MTLKTPSAPSISLDCPFCGGTGYDWTAPFPHYCIGCEEGRYKLSTHCAEALENSEMPKRYRHFDNFETWEKLPDDLMEGKVTAILIAREMVRRPLTAFAKADLDQLFAGDTTERHSLMLYGSNGFGKSTLACTIVNHYVKQGIEARFITPRGLWFRVKATFNNNGEHETDIMKEMIAVPVLVLDEFNAPPSDSASLSNVIEHIIRERYNSETPKPVIVTTNAEDDELKPWGRQTLSCLFEMAHRARMGGLPFRDEGVQPSKESF